MWMVEKSWLDINETTVPKKSGRHTMRNITRCFCFRLISVCSLTCHINRNELPILSETSDLLLHVFLAVDVLQYSQYTIWHYHSVSYQNVTWQWVLLCKWFTAERVRCSIPFATSLSQGSIIMFFPLVLIYVYCKRK